MTNEEAYLRVPIMLSLCLTDDSDDDDVLQLKRRNHELTDDISTLKEEELLKPESRKSKQPLTKAAVAKKFLKKKIQANKKVVFDEDGQVGLQYVYDVITLATLCTSEAPFPNCCSSLVRLFLTQKAKNCLPWLKSMMKRMLVALILKRLKQSCERKIGLINKDLGKKYVPNTGNAFDTLSTEFVTPLLQKII